LIEHLKPKNRKEILQQHHESGQNTGSGKSFRAEEIIGNRESDVPEVSVLGTLEKGAGERGGDFEKPLHTQADEKDHENRCECAGEHKGRKIGGKGHSRYFPEDHGGNGQIKNQAIERTYDRGRQQLFRVKEIAEQDNQKHRNYGVDHIEHGRTVMDYRGLSHRIRLDVKRGIPRSPSCRRCGQPC